MVDGETDALFLLGIVEDAQYLLIIDAIEAGRPGGTIKYIVGQEIPLLVPEKMSAHQIGFQEVLALASLRGRLA